jgi:hypothetical protein
MGRTVTPKYRVEMIMHSRRQEYSSTAAWDVTSRGMITGKGKPTAANLLKEVQGFEASTGPDGVNKHLGPMKVTHAHIIHQHSGAIMAEYSADQT